MCSERTPSGVLDSPVRFMAQEFVIRRACAEDADFVGIGIREAERCHAGIGIFDTLAGKTVEDIFKSDRSASDEVSSYLKHCFLNDTHSHVHMANFLVLVHASTGRLAACACNYPHPEFGIYESFPGLKIALKEVQKYSEEEINISFERLNFLDSSFPDVDYSNCWCIEAVYVSPEFRGCGLGRMIMEASMNDQATRRFSLENNKERRILIICAVGNEVAKNLYEKLGFHIIGKGDSVECMKAINCSGFYVLSTQP